MSLIEPEPFDFWLDPDYADQDPAPEWHDADAYMDSDLQDLWAGAPPPANAPAPRQRRAA